MQENISIFECNILQLLITNKYTDIHKIVYIHCILLKTMLAIVGHAQNMRVRFGLSTAAAVTCPKLLCIPTGRCFSCLTCCLQWLRDLGHQLLIADTVSVNLLMTLTGYRTSLTSSSSKIFPHSERFSADVSQADMWHCSGYAQNTF